MIATPIEKLLISDIAWRCARDWKNVSPHARPYLEDMKRWSQIDQSSGNSNCRDVVVRFLSNASGWRGPVAKELKAELKRRLAL
jgi:hypothetical protein